VKQKPQVFPDQTLGALVANAPGVVMAVLTVLRPEALPASVDRATLERALGLEPGR
jgi:hypothetical protein